MIPALVLTAGLATRVRPLSHVRAKAAFPVAGEPLIRRICRWIAAAGVRDLVLNLHHLPHTITAVTGDGSDMGIRIRYSWEMSLLGSAGGPRRALPLLGSSFLIVNGDTLTDVNLHRLIGAHRTSGALVTMAVVPNREPDKYGGVRLNSDGTVAGFTRRGESASSFHFIGVQVAEADTFGPVPENRPCNSVGSLYPELIRARAGSIRGFVTDAAFFDVGTPADYLHTSLAMAVHDGRPGVTGARARIAPDATVIDSVLWDDVAIEAGARLDRCIVTDGVRVPAGTAWSQVTIRPATKDLDAAETVVGELAIARLNGR